MATSDAPISIGSITLIVKNLDRVADFYLTAIGLNVITRDVTSCTLGQGDRVLLKLIKDAAAKSYPREAGLFHTAFLMPDRRDLGSWLSYSDANKIKLDGAADHLVSEALYLTDPEGNGIELYVDRDRSEWTIADKQIQIDTLPLDFHSLQDGTTKPWTGLPEGSVIGHVHLQVGNIEEADEFYCKRLDFTQTAGMDRSSFYSTGGYHHHLAGNTWNSKGAQRRPVNSTGFHELELLVENGRFDFNEIEDPWGMTIRISEIATNV